MTYYCLDCTYETAWEENVDNHEEVYLHTMDTSFPDWEDPDSELHFA